MYFGVYYFSTLIMVVLDVYPYVLLCLWLFFRLCFGYLRLVWFILWIDLVYGWIVLWFLMLPSLLSLDVFGFLMLPKGERTRVEFIINLGINSNLMGE